MNLKKTFIILLALVMTTSLILTGCGGKSDDGAQGENVEGEVKDDEGKEKEIDDESKASADKIVVFQSKVEITDQLEALAEEYEDETGVQVEVWTTTGDDYFQQLKTKLGNNQGPTVLSVNPGAETLQLKSYLADLSDLSFVDKIAQGMANEVDGKVVGIPYTVEGFGLVYNNDMIDSSEVTDYDSFTEMLKAQKDDGINGFSLSQESYFLIGHILNTPFALQEDPSDFVEKVVAGEVKMADTPEFKEFAQFMESIREYTKNPLEINYDKEVGDLATGKTASIHQGNWCYDMFKDYELDFDLGMMPLPLCGNDKLPVSVPNSWAVNGTALEEEIQAGKDFLDWLYTSETGQKYLMEEFKFIPVVEGVESSNLDSLSAEVAKYTNEGNTIPWVMHEWPAGIVDVYLVPVAEEFFTTDMTGEEFLEALDDAFEQAGE